jgi:acyl carrier protein
MRTSTIRRESLSLPPYEAPKGELETAVAEIFAEVFDLDRVGANDEFFPLGGDSLIAEELTMRLAEYMRREFPLSFIHENDYPPKISPVARNKR